MAAAEPPSLPGAGAGAGAVRRTAFDREYCALVARVKAAGILVPCRQKDAAGAPVRAYTVTGETVRVPFGGTTRWDPARGRYRIEVPSLTVKHLPLATVAEELAWFLRGETNSRALEARGCKIWKADADKATQARLAAGVPEAEAAARDGDLGPIYGYQLCGRPDGNQVLRLVAGLCADPGGRRNVASCWDVAALGDMALPPCHFAVQLVSYPQAAGVRVDCVVSMRSADVGLGLPFNVASYALLTVLCCAEASRRAGRRYVPGEVVVNMGACHIYEAHMPRLEGLVRDVSPGAGRAAYVLDLPEALAGVDRFAKASSRALWKATRPANDPHDKSAQEGGDEPPWNPAPRVSLPLYT